jgi:hypothetical protein
MVSPITNASLQQWDTDSKGSRNVEAFMLNTDMQLLYDIDASTPSKNQDTYCRAYTDINDHTCHCPFLNESSPQKPDFAKQTSTQDEPGATRFMYSFSRAFQVMTKVGHGLDSLSCAQCIPTFCGSCTLSELCNASWLILTRTQVRLHINILLLLLLMRHLQ